MYRHLRHTLSGLRSKLSEFGLSVKRDYRKAVYRLKLLESKGPAE